MRDVNDWSHLKELEETGLLLYWAAIPSTSSLVLLLVLLPLMLHTHTRVNLANPIF